MTKDTGGPAFPGGVNQVYTNVELGDPTQEGMTLRDYFAAKAIQGLLSNPSGPIQANGMSGWDFCNCTPSDVALTAYTVADAMLKHRSHP